MKQQRGAKLPARIKCLADPVLPFACSPATEPLGSADWQSAVSPNGIRQAARSFLALGTQVDNLRYGSVPRCATLAATSS